MVGDGIRRDPFLLPTEFVITLDDPMEDDLSVAGGSTTSQLLARQVRVPRLDFSPAVACCERTVRPAEVYGLVVLGWVQAQPRIAPLRTPSRKRNSRNRPPTPGSRLFSDPALSRTRLLSPSASDEDLSVWVAAGQAGDGVVAWLSAHDSPFKPFDEDHLVATQAAVSDWLLGLQRTLPGQPPRSAFITLVAAATPPARPPLKRGPPFAKP